MMNRFFGGNKNRSQPATNLQLQKNKQIESLRKGSFSITEISRDVEYRVTLTVGSTNITLIILLPPQFPQDKPNVTVQPAVTHPWVDTQMKITGCPGLNNFSMHSDLGQIIQSIVDEFKRNPPTTISQNVMGQPAGGYQMPMPSTQLGYPPYRPPSLPPISMASPAAPQSISGYIPPNVMPALNSETNSVNPTAMSNTAVPDAGVDNFTIPDILKAFPALKDKKLFELQELVENEDKILELIQGIPDLNKFAEEREQVSVKCVALAKENLNRKPEVDELKQSLLEKLTLLESLKREFELDCERHLSLSEQFHPTHIQTNLKVAVLEAEEESEKIAEDFLNKKISIEEFTQKFMEKRTLCHMRRAKEEKLNQIIINLGHAY